MERSKPTVSVSPPMPSITSVGNWGVARALRAPSKEDVAIRLAYVHNLGLGDILVSLAPVAAGLATLFGGAPLFDTIIAIGIAGVIIATTLKAVRDQKRNYYGMRTSIADIMTGP